MTIILDGLLVVLIGLIEMLPDLSFVNIDPGMWEGLIDIWSITSAIVPYASIFGAMLILWSVQNAKLIWGIINWVANKIPITG